MISAQAQQTVSPPQRLPLASLGLVAAGAATLLMLAHHPVAEHHEGAGLLRDLADSGASAALVHGILIGIVGILLYGVIALALRLGARRPAVAFGLAAYGFGCAAMILAMLFDGFITASLARWLLASGQQHGGVPPTLALVAICIQVLARAGLAGMGLGICWLSWARVRATRLLAALALPAGLLPAAFALAGGVQVGPHILIALTGLQALWYAGAAWHLWRAPLSD